MTQVSPKTTDAVARLAAVRAEIARACKDAGRDPAEVTLVAVSKTHQAEAIEPVIAAGQRVFGENRVQEAKAKWPPLLGKQAGIELHLIGPLQSNKAKEAVALFDAIHTVDRPSLCEALAKEIARQGRHPLLFGCALAPSPRSLCVSTTSPPRPPRLPGSSPASCRLPPLSIYLCEGSC